MNRFRRAGVAVLLGVLTIMVVGVASPEAGAHDRHPEHGPHAHVRPVIFVHGFTGSGAQFETQAERLTSNGYPIDLVDVHEYDSLFGSITMAQVWDGLDQRISTLLDRSGADKVDLLGHSLGTSVLQGYLNSSPARAARVAHYVNLDGATATAPPGGVPTLAVWGEGNQARQIVGAQNVYLPNQSHVQTATSAETFAAFYRFFTGHEPRTTRVVPQHGHISLSGKADLFPSNAGADKATLQIWEVDGRTGARRGQHPKATFAIGPSGDWGPFRASPRKHYEFAVISGTVADQAHHFYSQPFRRSDHLIRLLTSEPGTGLDNLREKSDRHSSFTLIRYKELWGDQGTGSDELKINGTSVLSAANAPRTKRVNAIFVFDAHSDGVTDLSTPLPTLFALPFLTGIDVFVPAAAPPDATVRFELRSRTSPTRTAVVNVPNWQSSHHHISVQFRDDA
jgi:pimeloyl-ACP methyl ester carboxylesterase